MHQQHTLNATINESDDDECNAIRYLKKISMMPFLLPQKKHCNDSASNIDVDDRSSSFKEKIGF